MVRTAVSLVISFFNLSRKIAKTPWSSALRWSPRWHTMWPIQVIALSFTSWSMSVAFSLFRVTENTLERQQFYKILHTLNTESEIKPDLKTSREQTILTVKPLTFTSLGWLLCWYYSTVKGLKSNHTTDERRKQPCWTWPLIPLLQMVWGQILPSVPAASSPWPAAEPPEEPLRWSYRNCPPHTPPPEAAAPAGGESATMSHKLKIWISTQSLQVHRTFIGISSF